MDDAERLKKMEGVSDLLNPALNLIAELLLSEDESELQSKLLVAHQYIAMALCGVDSNRLLVKVRYIRGNS